MGRPWQNGLSEKEHRTACPMRKLHRLLQHLHRFLLSAETRPYPVFVLRVVSLFPPFSSRVVRPANSLARYFPFSLGLSTESSRPAAVSSLGFQSDIFKNRKSTPVCLHPCGHYPPQRSVSCCFPSSLRAEMKKKSTLKSLLVSGNYLLVCARLLLVLPRTETVSWRVA